MHREWSVGCCNKKFSVCPSRVWTRSPTGGAEVDHGNMLTSLKEQAVSVSRTACPTLWINSNTHAGWLPFINTHTQEVVPTNDAGTQMLVGDSQWRVEFKFARINKHISEWPGVLQCINLVAGWEWITLGGWSPLKQIFLKFWGNIF